LINEYQPLNALQLAQVDIDVAANRKRMKAQGYNERKKLDKQQVAKGPIRMAQPAMLAIMDAQQPISIIPDEEANLEETPSSSSSGQHSEKEARATINLLGHISNECKKAARVKNGSSYTQTTLSKFFPTAAPRE